MKVIPYCKLCHEWTFKEHTHEFSITFSQGSSTVGLSGSLGEQHITVCADSHSEAMDKAYDKYEHKTTYLPYYFIHSIVSVDRHPH